MKFLPHREVLRPNMLGEYAQGLQVGAAEADLGRMNALRGAVGEYGAGSPQARNMLGQVDPMAAMQMAQPQPMTADGRQVLGRAVQQALSLPEDQQPAAWAALAEFAPSVGVDVPPHLAQWPGTENAQMIAATLMASDDERSEFERLTANLPPDQARQALMVRLGLAPEAVAERAPKGPTFRAATPEEAARYGAAAGQVDEATGRFYPNNPPSGTRIETGPNGELLFAQGSGVDGNVPLGRSGQNAVEQLQIDSAKSLSRLERIETNLRDNPEFLESLTATGQLEQFGLKWADFINPELLTPEQRKSLANVTRARSDILDNVNFTIKEITGAAMTESEAKRIGATLPNINDTPTMFVSKLEAAMDRARSAVARYNYWRNGGFGDGVKDAMSAAPLSDMDRIMRERGSQLYQDAVASGLGGQEAVDRAARAFSMEFGI